MDSLPSELWDHIFQYFSVVSDVASSSPETWARIVVSNRIYSENPDPALLEINATKRSLGLVSKRFYELSRPLALESITLWTIDSVEYLALILSEKAQLASVASRYTKRIDFHIGGKSGSQRQSSSPSMVSSRHGYQDLGVFYELQGILEVVCPSLTYFGCHIHGDFNHSIGWIIDILRDICPFLEVLRWESWDSLPLQSVKLLPVLPSFMDLRVLDLSMAERERPVMLEAHDFPHAHTLIGPLEVICRVFQDVELPSLRTLICTPSVITICNMSQFFRRHGEKIESLDWRHATFHHRQLPEHCHNVSELVLNVFEDSLIESAWPDVKILGIVDKNANKEQTALILLYTLGLLDSQREKGNYAELKTIRILREQTVQQLRERSMMATQLYERRLRSWSIRLEDHVGELLVPPSS